MRTVRKAGRVKRQHPRVNVVAAEEIPGMIENDLVVIVVIVEERHFQGSRVGFERPRRERTDHEPIRQKSRVSGRRQVIAVAHQWPDVANIEAHDGQLAMPAHRIKRIERVLNQRDFVVPFDLDDPRRGVTLLCQECIVDFGCIEHGRVEDRVVTHQAFLGQHVAGITGLYQQQVCRLRTLEPPHRSSRQDNVVACLASEMPEIAVQLGGTRMQEQQFVAIGIAGQAFHATGHAPVANPAMRIREHGGRVPGTRRSGRQLAQIEGSRPQRSLDGAPAGRRISVIEKRRRSEETLLTHFPFVGALGKIAVRLSRSLPFGAGDRDIALHQMTPRRS